MYARCRFGAGASCRRALKQPTGLFSRAPLSGVSPCGASHPARPLTRLGAGHPPLRPSLHLLRTPSARKGQDKRASRALALRSVLRAFPLLRLAVRGRLAPRLALRRCSFGSTPARLRPTRFPPPRAFLPLPLHGGGLSRSPLSGSPARVGALRAPRRFKRSCRLRAALT